MASSGSTGPSGPTGAYNPNLQIPEPHHLGDKYSPQHPLPTVERYLQHQDERAALSKRQADEAKAATAADSRNATTSTGRHSSRRPGGGKTADVPVGDDKSNILFHPPPEIDLKGVFKSIEDNTRSAAAVVAATIIVLDFIFVGGGIKGILKSVFPAAGVAIAVYFILAAVAEKGASQKIEASAPQVEKIRFLPESVEWMNSLVDTIWQVVSEQVFRDVAQQIEDTIKGYVPVGFIKVKIADLGQGSNAVRILSMRALPDSEFQGMVPTHGKGKNMSEGEVKAQEERAAAEEGGIFYNLELALAYHGEPNASHKQRIHFDMVVMAGPVPLPIFVETKEFVITVRVRLQLHPDLPFLKAATFGLTEPPKVAASVALGYSGGMNLLNMPFLDSLIESQIKSNTASFVIPQTMTIDMRPYVGGTDAKNETDNVGLLFLKIRRAEGLSRQDSRGPGADPYVTVAFDQYEKPMYATKMITGDLNPIWEETTCILIDVDHIKRQEKLLLKIWDSDRTSPDDVTGIVEYPLQDLVKNAGHITARADKIQEEVAGQEAGGTLFWEVGYFPRAGFHRDLLNEEQKKLQKDKKDEELEMDALTCRPDPDYPSGILSVSVYQLINVEVPNPKGEDKDPKLPSPADDDNEDDLEVIEGYLPSTYCTADVNDHLALRTRVKSITKTPIFNSTVETFVTDWRNIIVQIAARDSRKKGKDFLIGAVVLKAAEIFKISSTLSEWYTLEGGGGSGRVRVAILFRSTTLKMPKQLLGWDLGRFELSEQSSLQVSGFSASKIKLRTGGPSQVIRASANNVFNLPKGLRVPVFHRYLAPVILEFFTGGSDRKPAYYCIIWLHNLIDNETRDFDLTVYKTDNPRRFTQNVVESVENKLLKLDPVGTVKFIGRFKSGLCPEFRDCLDDPDEEDTFEVFEALMKMSKRRTDEADTGMDHDGVITGTDNARHPDQTYHDHVASGGTGVISDKEARNASSQRTADHVVSGETGLPAHNPDDNQPNSLRSRRTGTGFSSKTASSQRTDTGRATGYGKGDSRTLQSAKASVAEHLANVGRSSIDSSRTISSDAATLESAKASVAQHLGLASSNSSVKTGLTKSSTFGQSQSSSSGVEYHGVEGYSKARTSSISSPTNPNFFQNPDVVDSTSSEQEYTPVSTTSATPASSNANYSEPLTRATTQKSTSNSDPYAAAMSIPIASKGYGDYNTRPAQSETTAFQASSNINATSTDATARGLSTTESGYQPTLLEQAQAAIGFGTTNPNDNHSHSTAATTTTTTSDTTAQPGYLEQAKAAIGLGPTEHTNGYSNDVVTDTSAQPSYLEQAKAAVGLSPASPTTTTDPYLSTTHDTISNTEPGLLEKAKNAIGLGTTETAPTSTDGYTTTTLGQITSTEPSFLDKAKAAVGLDSTPTTTMTTADNVTSYTTTKHAEPFISTAPAAPSDATSATPIMYSSTQNFTPVTGSILDDTRFSVPRTGGFSTSNSNTYTEAPSAVAADRSVSGGGSLLDQARSAIGINTDGASTSKPISSFTTGTSSNTSGLSNITTSGGAPQTNFSRPRTGSVSQNAPDASESMMFKNNAYSPIGGGSVFGNQSSFGGYNSDAFTNTTSSATSGGSYDSGFSTYTTGNETLKNSVAEAPIFSRGTTTFSGSGVSGGIAGFGGSPTSVGGFSTISTLGGSVLDQIRSQSQTVQHGENYIHESNGGVGGSGIGGGQGYNEGFSDVTGKRVVNDKEGNVLPKVESDLNAKTEPAIYAEPITRLT